MDSVVLESVRTDVNSTLVLFRTIHGTLNSVLSLVGSLADALRQNTTLLDDCAQVEQSLSSLQDRLNGNEHNACSINGTTAPHHSVCQQDSRVRNHGHTITDDVRIRRCHPSTGKTSHRF